MCVVCFCRCLHKPTHPFPPPSLRYLRHRPIKERHLPPPRKRARHVRVGCDDAAHAVHQKARPRRRRRRAIVFKGRRFMHGDGHDGPLHGRDAGLGPDSRRLHGALAQDAGGEGDEGRERRGRRRGGGVILASFHRARNGAALVAGPQGRPPGGRPGAARKEGTAVVAVIRAGPRRSPAHAGRGAPHHVGRDCGQVTIS